MFGKLSVGDQVREKHIRFRNSADNEAYINVIDERYEAEDALFNGYNYKINTLQFNLVRRSQGGIGCDLKHEIIEDPGNICFIPTKGYCFIKCIKYLTGGDYKEQYLDFIRNEERRSNIMTMVRVQPCLRKVGVHLGYYNGEEIWPRNITEKNIALSLYNNHFCLI